MARVHNFNAGPATLPLEVMQKAQAEFTDYQGLGYGIMEASHRAPEFAEILAAAEANIRELLQVGEEYAVLFLQGGASLQFSMLPMNLAAKGATMDYADTGSWSSKAIKEAKAVGTVNEVASSKADNYQHIPDPRQWDFTAGAAYVHVTSNNTIAGTQYHTFPEPPTEVPLCADMSSDILSRPVDVRKFGLIYAGAQKNLGPSGVTIVIVRKDLADRAPADLPTMLSYNTHISKDSCFNTPPTFAIYMVKLVTEWLKEQGGMAHTAKINRDKAAKLYHLIDVDEFYHCPVNEADRSHMNVVFRLPSEELEKTFIAEAAKQGLVGLKGHRSVGGCRASIYNAMPMGGVEALCDFMRAFKQANG